MRDALGSKEAPSGFLRQLNRRAHFDAVARAADAWRKRRIDDWVHIGIGGSSLGAEALLRALGHPKHNLLPRARRKAPRIHFVDNVDPDALAGLLDVLDPSRTAIHVVSKSGGTVETAASFQILRDVLQHAAPRGRWATRCVATTGQGALAALAAEVGFETLPFPDDVGGRFSALTASGLLTPAVAGVDIQPIVAGARRFAKRVAAAPIADDPAALAAIALTQLDQQRGKPIHVLMPYADALEPLARWFVQLSGESLGKIRARDGVSVGPTPLPARGTTDQHSQVQLFVEGPADKVVIFVAPETTAREQTIPGGAPAPYLDGVSLGALLRAEQQGTAIALARAGRPSMTWVMPQLDGHALGQLLVALELQTAYQAALYEIDAYDQPGVEAGKVAAFALIGREGYEDERARIESDAPPSWRI